jgi:hypothetical protein
MLDADRIERLGERDSDIAQIGLVIPDSDVVIGVAVDKQNLNLTWGDAGFVKPANCAYGRP